jgi:long-chain fatty acid transport protein
MSDFKFDGNATIDGKLLSDEERQKQNNTLTWDMPERLVFSGSHQVTTNLQLFWDFERVFFDDFESTDLSIDGYPKLVIDRNFKDANRYAIGGEYALNDRLTLQLGLSYDESPVDDSDRMPDIPVEEIIKTAIGTIYRVNDKLTVHGYAIAEFLGDGQIEQLASINGEKIDHSFNMDTDTVIYVFGVSFGYTF